MAKETCLALAGFLLTGPVTSADPVVQQVHSLIKHLNSDNFYNRRQATRELETLGPPALGELQRFLKERNGNLTLDLRCRIESIVRQIENNNPEIRARKKAKYLIKLLDSNRFKTRVAASRALKEMGRQALPELEKTRADPNCSIEVIRRLEVLIGHAKASRGRLPTRP